jgi:DNA-binding HxlR family transcriptional regulator
MVAALEVRGKYSGYEDAYEAARILSKKFVLAVLAELAKRPRSHNELARAIGLIEHKPLDRALHQLRGMQLIERNVLNISNSAPRVNYRLTARGYSLIPVINELAAWWQAIEATANEEAPLSVTDGKQWRKKQGAMVARCSGGAIIINIQEACCQYMILCSVLHAP